MNEFRFSGLTRLSNKFCLRWKPQDRDPPAPTSSQLNSTQLYHTLLYSTGLDLSPSSFPGSRTRLAPSIPEVDIVQEAGKKSWLPQLDLVLVVLL